ncbi:NADP-dependent oxidoreductase domain-containing protein [Desarmillaria tabescens]|uniref:NADP-dependent oxidoreductase domain-containing protein n=1 Tax=Armillaria tabescens TaxID=1929756 RepID=A0AA39MP03_ARMTA|nr:NADP-dependent oxidoreductase domain-containing protein [Desarmillaria tabescens]KAK0440465.1 NADP-dependent oxidoreductase domain-containing protein [Desarmillaria tabescens]
MVTLKPKPVEYRQLGSSGLRVSVPILGAMSFGSPKWLDWVLDEEHSFPILKAAWDRGINTIDTANVYSNGESERIIGAFMEKVCRSLSNTILWLKHGIGQYQVPRQEIVIATKCHRIVGKDATIRGKLSGHLKKTRDYVNQWGLSRAAIFNAVEASLPRLKTNYIDLLQIHRYDDLTPPEETMKALHDLVQSGKVRYIGASSMPVWKFALLNEVARRNGWTTFVSMQCEYSLLYREEEREMFDYCKYHGIGIIPWAPVAGGYLTRSVDESTKRSESGGFPRPKLTDVDKIIIGRVEEVAKRCGASMAQIALAWVSAKVVSPIVGISSIKRLEENVVGVGRELSEEDILYLEEAYIPKPVHGFE